MKNCCDVCHATFEKELYELRYELGILQIETAELRAENDRLKNELIEIRNKKVTDYVLKRILKSVISKVRR